jgi:ATPase subunit of ABC transporter with duplicated ATPase domains
MKVAIFIPRPSKPLPSSEYFLNLTTRFSVARDEIIAVIGLNGSGKMTLFDLIMHCITGRAEGSCWAFPQSPRVGCDATRDLWRSHYSKEGWVRVPDAPGSA